MKNIKQIRETYNLITEKEEAEDRKFATLVRAGLYDAKKLPALKKALEKSAEKMTAQEKRMLLNLLNSLIDQVVSNDQVYRKVKQNVEHLKEMKDDYIAKTDPRYKMRWPSDKQIPSVIILKRKAIRVYPDNQKVALYHSQAIDKYVTIPFSDIHVGEVNEAVKPKKPSKTKDDKKKAVIGANALQYFKKKNAETRAKASDALNRVYKKGEFSSPAKRFMAVRSRVGTTGGAIGVMLNDLARRKSIKAKVAAKRKTISASPAKTVVTESFRRNLTEARQVNEVAPLVAAGITALRAAGPTIARGIAAGARAAAPYVSRGVAAARGFGKRVLDKFKGKKAKQTKPPKNTKQPKGKKGGKAGAVGRGIAAAGLGLGGGSSAPTATEPAGRQYQFSLKPSTGSSWQNRADSQAVQRRRDERLARQSQQALMKENFVIPILKNMIDKNIVEETLNFNEQEININNTVAKKIMHVYESVNSTNKKKMEKMMNESAESFNKILTFAIRQ